jgi:hypothetical protein
MGARQLAGGMMADLTADERNALPSSTFGLPKERSYPMPDRTHASNAKARARQQLDAGQLTRVQYDKICAKADRILYGP